MFLPFVGTIAAGCPAVLKPSELAPHCSAVMATLVSKYLDPDAYAVIQGGPELATSLLEYRWDHIFFTGSGRVGRIIAAAAAKHVTPLSLELGGKCPVFVDAESDVELAAKRTLYGKIQNSGQVRLIVPSPLVDIWLTSTTYQVCVTPDFALVHRAIRPQFEEGLKKAYKSFFPDGALAPNVQYSKIVTEHHLERLKGLIKNTKGKIIIGGQSKGDKIEPTIVSGVKIDDILMKEYVRLVFSRARY